MLWPTAIGLALTLALNLTAAVLYLQAVREPVVIVVNPPPVPSSPPSLPTARNEARPTPPPPRTPNVPVVVPPTLPKPRPGSTVVVTPPVPPPTPLRGTVLLLVLATEDAVSGRLAGQLANEVGKLQKRFGSELVGGQVYLVDAEKSAGWPVAGSNPRVFRRNDFTAAFAAGLKAVRELTTRMTRPAEVAPVIIWASDYTPSVSRRDRLPMDYRGAVPVLVWVGGTERGNQVLTPFFGTRTYLLNDPGQLASVVSDNLANLPDWKHPPRK